MLTLLLASAFSTTEFGLTIGNEPIGGVSYRKIGIYGDFEIWKFGVGIDGVIHFNQDGIRKEDIDFTRLQTWLNLFRYIRFGHKKMDPFYFRIGILDSETLGHGLLVRDYNNRSLMEVAQKVRKPGLSLYLDTKFFGFEALTSSLLPTSWSEISTVRKVYNAEIPGVTSGTVPIEFVIDKEISYPDEPLRLIAGRAFFHPLYWVAPLRKFSIGVSAVVDRKPGYNITEDSDPAYVDGKLLMKEVWNRGGSPLYGFGADVELPFDFALLKGYLYSDVAWIVDEDPADFQFSLDSPYRGAAVPGVMFLLPLGFTFRMEYRDYNDLFRYSLFDYNYETSHPSAEEYSSHMNLTNVGRRGIFGELSMESSILEVKGAYERSQAKDLDRASSLGIPETADYLELRASVKKALFEKIKFSDFISNVYEVSAYYVQRDIDWLNFSVASPSTRYGVRLVYSLGGARIKSEYNVYYIYEGTVLVPKKEFLFETQIGF